MTDSYETILNELHDTRSQLQSSEEEVTRLKRQLAWFQKQQFGEKSEKRIIDHPDQLNLLGDHVTTPAEDEPKKDVAGYKRGTAKKQRDDDCVNDTGLRFTDEVPVEVIDVIPEELKGEDADRYEIIDTKISYKLAQRPSAYVVLEYRLPVIKRKTLDQDRVEAPELKSTPIPDQVLETCLADVSLLAGLLVNKFVYHLPLHRQHKLLKDNGITVSRASLTNWTKRAIELLRPIVESMLNHILCSKVLAIDETPIKAGLQKKGKMKSCWFWPVYGEDDEVVFTFSESRGRRHLEKTLSNHWQGTLISDGHSAYANYCARTENVTHAQCWVHSRRYLVKAEDGGCAESCTALDLIGRLYKIEDDIRAQNLSGDKKRKTRLEHSKPLVDEVFSWINEQQHRNNLTPSDPLSRAIDYIAKREVELRVFLENPDVAMDTNHLEREIRPIPMGRKNWSFCWTELGAEHVGIIQSLMSTCRLHGVNPYTYLVDVLQRIDRHPASKISELTPRLWQENFGDTVLKSPLG